MTQTPYKKFGQDGPNSNNVEGTQEAKRGIGSYIVRLFIYIFILWVVISLFFTTAPKCEFNTKLYQPRLYDQQQYGPQQLHLSLGADSSEFYVTYSTLRPVGQSRVVYAKISNYDFGITDIETTDWPDCSDAQIKARMITEEDSDWSRITKRNNRILYSHRAKLTGLQAGATYSYQVITSTLEEPDVEYNSPVYQFRTRSYEDANKEFNVSFFGDLGLINGQSIPRLTRDVDDQQYDVIIHNGDFAYDLDTNLGEYGDAFMRLMEPIAARVPYQTSVGNHEIAENFTHYDLRFTMVNSGGHDVGKQNNFFYSFNVGPVHFVAFSTEFYYFLDKVGIVSLSEQYRWLEADLDFASQPAERAERPWIIVFGHRPMYCSSRDRDDCAKESNILRNGLPFTHAFALESLFYKYGVDVEIYSHEHQYERFYPIYRGQVVNGTDDPDNGYHNPLGPVHIISGSAGCEERLDPFKGKKAPGSAKQIVDYGYTRMRANRCKLEFQQISDDKYGSIVDEFVLSKTRQNFPQRRDIDFDCDGKISHGTPDKSSGHV